ncbi:SAM-dependent methyltransferase [Nocardia niigatensis]|uniref:SAM-dependent methyltransferase n=1 Tax=Nocardia niigatensis TaxID=209249 RepID=UPI000A02D689
MQRNKIRRQPPGGRGSAEPHGSPELRFERRARCVRSRWEGTLAPGSFLVICTITADFAPAQVAAAQNVYRIRTMPVQVRTHEELTAWFTGLDLISPGIVPHAAGPHGNHRYPTRIRRQGLLLLRRSPQTPDRAIGVRVSARGSTAASCC